MRKTPKRTDDDYERLELEAEEVFEEAQRALDRAQELFDNFGFDEDDRKKLSEFLNSEPSEELDDLRRELFGHVTVEEQLLAEEKRLVAEENRSAGAQTRPAARPRRNMTRV